MIRLVKGCEQDRVMDIWLNTTIAAHDFISKEYWLKNYDTVKNEYLPISDTYIYVEERIIKGFVSVIDNFFIGALFVEEIYQGKGIGKNLLNYCKNNYDRLELAVYLDNLLAVSFYVKNGFKLSEERQNEDSGFMEYIMSWEGNIGKLEH